MVLPEQMHPRRIVVVLAVQQFWHLQHLPQLRLVNFALYLVKVLKIYVPLVTTLDKLLLIHIIPGGVLLGDSVQAHRSPRHHCSVAINVIRHFFAEIAFDSLEHVSVPLSIPFPLTVDVNFPQLYNVNPLFPIGLVNELPG